MTIDIQFLDNRTGIIIKFPNDARYRILYYRNHNNAIYSADGPHFEDNLSSVSPEFRIAGLNFKTIAARVIEYEKEVRVND